MERIIEMSNNLYCIFSYVNMMSIVRRSQRKEFLMMYGLLTLIYLSGVVIEIASGRLSRSSAMYEPEPFSAALTL